MARQRKIPKGIYERKNRWMVDTYYKGQRLRDSFASLDAAIENLNKMKSLVDEGKYLEKKKECKETLGEFADRYIKWCEDMKQKAWKSKKSHLESIKHFFGKDTTLSRINRSDVENYNVTDHRKTYFFEQSPATRISP